MRGRKHVAAPKHTYINVSYLRNAVPVRGRKLIVFLISWTFFSYLRNAVPVRGRKQLARFIDNPLSTVFEKCSPREGTETCGKLETVYNDKPEIFEKCSPREGTETRLRCFSHSPRRLFEKCSPREGTETKLLSFSCYLVSNLRNAVPVRGRKRFLLKSLT